MSRFLSTLSLYWPLEESQPRRRLDSRLMKEEKRRGREKFKEDKRRGRRDVIQEQKKNQNVCIALDSTAVIVQNN